MLPEKSELASLVKSLLPARGFVLQRHGEPLDDTVYPDEETAGNALEACDEADEFAPVSETLTVGWTPSGGWSYQTGDNSFTGGAYGHPVWAVVYLTADSIPDEVAGEILDELSEMVAW